MKYRITYDSIKVEMLLEPVEVKMLNNMAIAFTKDQTLTNDSMLDSLVKKIAAAKNAIDNEVHKIVELR